jgi:hypothetical protein
MVVLLRTLGVPSRVVNGFQRGTYSGYSRAWVIRERDAHTWVEAWIPGRGWTTYDPTPPSAVTEGVGIAGMLSELWFRTQLFWDNRVIGFNYTYQVNFLLVAREKLHELVSKLRRVDKRKLGWPALAIVSLLVMWRLLRSIRWRRRARSTVPFYNHVLRLLARRGYRRRPGQTPGELAGEVARRAGPGGEALLELTRLYYAARFGGRPADPERVDALLQRIRHIPAARDGLR